mmetsp:Transcript_73730/g.221677  ORF Transcript_73730/g.221677 Transcript_73730/m.221677 type:complete len:403 (-) Transcript_73730:635-1843(-)
MNSAQSIEWLPSLSHAFITVDAPLKFLRSNSWPRRVPTCKPSRCFISFSSSVVAFISACRLSYERDERRRSSAVRLPTSSSVSFSRRDFSSTAAASLPKKEPSSRSSSEPEPSASNFLKSSSISFLLATRPSFRTCCRNSPPEMEPSLLVSHALTRELIGSCFSCSSLPSRTSIELADFWSSICRSAAAAASSASSASRASAARAFSILDAWRSASISSIVGAASSCHFENSRSRKAVLTPPSFASMPSAHSSSSAAWSTWTSSARTFASSCTIGIVFDAAAADDDCLNMSATRVCLWMRAQPIRTRSGCRCCNSASPPLASSASRSYCSAIERSSPELAASVAAVGRSGSGLGSLLLPPSFASPPLDAAPPSPPLAATLPFGPRANSFPTVLSRRPSTAGG